MIQDIQGGVISGTDAHAPHTDLRIAEGASTDFMQRWNSADLLVLPGQGLLTMLIGLLLLDFPGKRAVELKLVRRPGIAAFLNRMRARHGRPPFVVQ